MASSYTVVISEEQRLLLMAALAALVPLRAPTYDMSAEDEPHALAVGLSVLPRDEDESPGVIHGLCV